MNDPYQSLMFAVWTQALSDINRGHLLKKGIYKVKNEKRASEVKENAKEALEWVRKAPHTFQLVAGLCNIPVKVFQHKTIDVIDLNKRRIDERSTLTTQLMYTTVSRFRDYNKAFLKNNINLRITVS